MNAGEYNGRLLALVDEIRAAELDYRDAIEQAADAERLYKRAQAWVFVQESVRAAKNAGERDARAEMFPVAGGGTINDLRYEAHCKEGLVNACKLAVQNRHAELSALQSEAALARSEAELLRFADTGP